MNVNNNRNTFLTSALTEKRNHEIHQACGTPNENSDPFAPLCDLILQFENEGEDINSFNVNDNRSLLHTVAMVFLAVVTFGIWHQIQTYRFWNSIQKVIKEEAAGNNGKTKKAVQAAYDALYWGADLSPILYTDIAKLIESKAPTSFLSFVAAQICVDIGGDDPILQCFCYAIKSLDEKIQRLQRGEEPAVPQDVARNAVARARLRASTLEGEVVGLKIRCEELRQKEENAKSRLEKVRSEELHMQKQRLEKAEEELKVLQVELANKPANSEKQDAVNKIERRISKLNEVIEKLEERIEELKYIECPALAELFKIVTKLRDRREELAQKQEQLPRLQKAVQDKRNSVEGFQKQELDEEDYAQKELTRAEEAVKQAELRIHKLKCAIEGLKKDRIVAKDTIGKLRKYWQGMQSETNNPLERELWMEAWKAHEERSSVKEELFKKEFKFERAKSVLKKALEGVPSDDRDWIPLDLMELTEERTKLFEILEHAVGKEMLRGRVIRDAANAFMEKRITQGIEPSRHKFA